MLQLKVQMPPINQDICPVVNSPSPMEKIIQIHIQIASTQKHETPVNRMTVSPPQP